MPAPPARARTAPARGGSRRSRITSAGRNAVSTVGPRLRLARAAAPGRAGRGAAGSGRTPVVLFAVVLLVATALGLLFLNTATAVDSLKATQLAAANAERAEEVQRLEQQVIAGGTSAHLASAATAAGLVPAGAAAYLVVGADGTAVLRGQPAPAEGPPAPPSSGEAPDEAASEGASPADEGPGGEAPAGAPAAGGPTADGAPAGIGDPAVGVPGGGDTDAGDTDPPPGGEG